MATTADYNLGLHTFPRGWFAIASSAELGKLPLPLRYFARDFAVYRTAAGMPVLLDAYCPHMGTHLASGPTSATARRGVQIVGDSIRCPLHGWRFAQDGRCVDIPYSSSEPPASARIRSYPIREHGGLILMWHDPENEAPNFDPAPFPEWDDAAWLRSEVLAFGTFDVHPTEIVDHHVDKVHHVNTHGFDGVDRFITTFDRHRLSQYHLFRQETEAGAQLTEAISDYRGSGTMLVRVDSPVPLVVFFAHTPIEDGKVRAWQGLAMKRSGASSDADDRTQLNAILQSTRQSFIEDLEILVQKRPSFRPIQFAGDGPFRKVRQWYSQFYAPRAQAEAIQNGINGDTETTGAIPTPWATTARGHRPNGDSR